MRFRRLHRIVISWLAILVMTVVSFVPAISQAVSSRSQAHARDGLSWMELCSAAGTSWVKAADDAATADELPGSVPGHLFQHCPFCFMHLDLIPAQASLAGAVRLPHGRDRVPAAYLHAPHTLHAWTAAQSPSGGLICDGATRCCRRLNTADQRLPPRIAARRHSPCDGWIAGSQDRLIRPWHGRRCVPAERDAKP